MSVISVEGLQIHYITKSIPSITDLTVKLEKIELKDPQIKDIVTRLNPKMDKHKLIVEHVLETVTLHEHNADGLSVIEEDNESDAYYSARSEDFDNYIDDR